MIKFITSLVLIPLFAFALIMFSVDFSRENNTFANITNDQAIYNNFTSINGSVQAFEQDANGSLVGFYQADFSSGADSSTAAANIKLGDGGFLDMAGNVISSTYYSVVGGDSNKAIFLTSLISLLGIMAVAYFWAAAKGGNVE